MPGILLAAVSGALLAALLVTLLVILPANPLYAQAPDQGPGEALLLAQLEARRQVAVAERDAAAAYFAGREGISWESAFPTLAAVDLHDPEVVAVERWRLLTEGAACTPTGRQPPAEVAAGWSSRDRQRWDEAQEFTCAAEAEARQLRARFLTAVAEGLTHAPAYTRSRLREELAAYETARQRRLSPRSAGEAEPAAEGTPAPGEGEPAPEPQGAPPPAAGPPAPTVETVDPRQPEGLALAVEANTAAATLRRHGAAALRAMTLVGDGALPALVAADLDQMAALPPSFEDGETPVTLLRRGVRYRLRAALPLLDPALATGVREALEADFTREVDVVLPRLREAVRLAEEAREDRGGEGETPGTEETTAPLGEEAARARLDALEARLPELQRRARQPPAVADPALHARLEERAQLEHYLARLHIAQLQRQLGEAVEDEGLTRQEAETETRSRAAEAQEEAAETEQEQGNLTAQERYLQAPLLKVQQETARLLEEEAARHTQRNELLDQLEESLRLLREKEREGRSKAELSPERQRLLDESFRELQNLLAELHRELAAQIDTSQHFRDEAALLRATLPAGAEGLEGWSKAEERLEGALVRRRENSHLELEALVRLHRDAQQMYWALRPEVSEAIQQTPLPHLERDALREVAEAPALLALQGQAAAERFAGWYARLKERRSWILTLAEGGHLLLVIFSLFLLVQLLRQIRPWMHWWLDLSPARGMERPNLRNAAVATARALVLLGAFWLLARPWWDFPLFLAVGLPALALLLYRCLSKASRLGVEALHGRWQGASYGLEMVRRTLRTIRLLSAWWLLCWMVERLMDELLHAEALLELTDDFFQLALLILLVYLLLHWTPVLRRIVGQDAHRNFVAGWLARPPKRGGGRWQRLARWPLIPLHELPRGVGSLGYLALHGLSRRLDSQRGEAQEVAHLQAALGRAQLQAGGDELRRLDGSDGDEEGARIRAATAARYGQREAEATALKDALTACLSTERRGLIAVIGDRGGGKSSLVRHAAALVEDVGTFLVTPLHLEARTVNPDRALRWLAGALKVRIAAGTDRAEAKATLVRRLQKRRPTLFLVDDLHRLMLRTVGGLDAVRLVLEIFQEAAEHHCFVIGFHAPSWQYLETTAVSLDLDMFRSRIALCRVSGEWLRGWLEGGLGDAGFEARYHRLRRHGTESEADLREQYFQLLAEESQGIPGIALHFWFDSLRQPIRQDKAAASTRHAVVTLFSVPSVRDLEASSDLSLFVLKALWVHGELSLDHLSRTLNRPQGVLREACGNLVDQGILERQGGVYGVVTPWQPAVRNLLRQKHFLHNRGER